MNPADHPTPPPEARAQDPQAAPEPYETPRLIQTGSLHNVLGKSQGGTELVNRFRVAGRKT